MAKKLLLKLFILIFSISYSQNTLGTISINTDVYEGYTLFSTHTKSFLIDNCGQVINSWSSSYLPGNAVYLLPNGNLLRAGRLLQGTNPVALPGAGGIIELFDWDGNLLWSLTDSSNFSRQHHDVFPMPNGNILILSATVMDENEAIQAGRDPSLIDTNNQQVYNERIYEVAPNFNTGAFNVVWEWNVKDHLVQDFDASKDNFGVIANNPGKINFNFLNGFDVDKNWLHINSIQYDEEFDQIVISSRRMSELWVIDHNTTTTEATGVAGDLLYRWGNPQSYNQGTETDRQLFGQHTPYYIPSGFANERKIMVFNNGFGRMPEYSEVFIIDPPVDSNGNYTYLTGTAFGPSETFFKFPETAPSANSDFFSGIVSSARQLPNGNILVCEGREAYFFELNENNEVVWEYASPINNADGTASEQGETIIQANNFAFRATKYSLDYPAFTGRDLTPSPPLETNPNIAACLNVLSDDEFSKSNVVIYPNPTSDYVTLQTNQTIDKIELFSVTGKKIAERSNSKTISLRNQKQGIYFIKAYSNGSVLSEKIIKK